MEATDSLEDMVAALTAAGYCVSFSREPEGYVASVSRAAQGDGERYEHDAYGDSVAAALRRLFILSQAGAGARD